MHGCHALFRKENARPAPFNSTGKQLPHRYDSIRLPSAVRLVSTLMSRGIFLYKAQTEFLIYSDGKGMQARPAPVSHPPAQKRSGSVSPLIGIGHKDSIILETLSTAVR